MLNKALFNKKEYCQILGLTENELAFYLVLVKLGKCSVQKAAKEMGIFRSSAYVLVDSLAKKGIISQEFSGNKRSLVPEQPKVLLRLIKEKEAKVNRVKKEIEDKIVSLSDLYDKSKHDPKVRFYEGSEGLKAIHEDILETGETLYCYPRLDDAMKILPLKFQCDFVKERVARKIKAKGIVSMTPGTELVLEKSREVLGSKDDLREMRILPDHMKENLTAEKMFYGNKVAYMTYGKKVTGVVIENEEIAELEKKHFEILWNVSNKYDYK